MPSSAFLSRVTQWGVMSLMLASGLPAPGEDRPATQPNRTLPSSAPTVATPKSTKGLASDNAPTAKETAVAPTRIISRQQTADEEAIRAAGAEFVKAYEAGDAAALAAQFAPDAEFIDAAGTTFQGRPAIAEILAEFFAENSDCKLEKAIDTLRFVAPGVAIEDGVTTVTRNGDPSPFQTRYTTLHVKVDGQWQVASVRDHAPKDQRQHRSELQQLGWLEGDWVDEGDDAIVTFSCRPVENGNFLLRTFAIVIAGQESLQGTQRIGWDPLTGKLRTWIFDSEGAYGEGYWHRDGADWVLKTTGVTADGQTASSTSRYTFVNEHTMTWQSVDHEIGGVELPDSEIYTIVRQSPAPAPDLAEDRQ